MKIINKNSKQQKEQKKLIKSQAMQNQTQCPICLIDYDLIRVIPMMICFNQHSTCQKCLPDIYKTRKCPICCQQLISKVNIKKNRLVCFLLQEMFKGNGEVLLYSNKYTYKGEVKDGKRHGMGQQVTKDGTYFRGNFVHGQLTGKCQATTKNGATFEGDAKNGKIQGVFTTKYGSIVEGIFDMDTLSGPDCKKTYTNGDVYVGMVRKLKANGYGKLKFKNGNIFEGKFDRDYISQQSTGTITGTFQVQILNNRSFIKQIDNQISPNQYQVQQRRSQSQINSEIFDDDFVADDDSQSDS